MIVNFAKKNITLLFLTFLHYYRFFILFSTCLLNFNTSLLTQDEGIRSGLWGDFIIATSAFFFNKITHMLYTYFRIILTYIICPSPYYHYILTQFFLFHLLQCLQLYPFRHIVLQNWRLNNFHLVYAEIR